MEKRYWVARLVQKSGEDFVLLEESIPLSRRQEEAARRLELGREWLKSNGAEEERFALQLRGFAHHYAALLQEQQPDLGMLGVEGLQTALLRREARQALSERVGPALAASLLSELMLSGPEESRTALDRLDLLWTQALGQRGRAKMFLLATLTLHHRTAATVVAEVLNLPWRPDPVGPSTVTELPVPLSLFRAGPNYLYVMNNLPYHAVREALALRKFTNSEDSPWPTAEIRKGATQGQAQLFPVEMEINPYREPDEQQQLIETMWRQVSELNDLDADVLDMMSALWIGQARNPNDFARVSVRELLEMRGLRAKTGEGGRSSGYRPEQKQALFQAIQHISNLFLLIQDMDAPRAEGAHKGERREVRSRAFVVTDIMGNRTAGGMSLEIEEFLIRPGVLFGYFLFGPGRQLALLSSKAIQYDRVRQDWEKRLARYFSWQWRNDASRLRVMRQFLVRTLLENTGKAVDNEHPKRTRDRLEKALSQLAADDVIASWRWERSRTASREPRNWADYWLDWAIEVEMPVYVQKQYQYILGEAPEPKSRALALAEATSLPLSSSSSSNSSSAEPIELRLALWRQERGLSQADAARRLGVTQSYYSLIERRQRKLTPELRRKIESLLEAPE